MLEPNTVIASKYKIIGLFGEGASSHLYKAKQLELDRFVAIKILKSSFAGSDAKHRFEREAKNLAKCRDPLIASFVSYGYLDQDTPYIVAEWCEGEMLRKLLVSGRIDENLAFPIALKICEGMAHAHKLDIVHRDLKPENIIVSDSRELKIVDFGSSIDVQSQKITKTGAIIGTPAYLSPEQCEGKRADTRSDIYALGCILHELFLGPLPFNTLEPAVLLHQKSTAIQFPDNIHGDEAKRVLASVIGKCMAPSPAERYTDMDAVQSDLLLVQNQELGPLKATLIKPRKKITPVTVALLVAIVLIAGGLAYIAATSDTNKADAVLIRLLTETTDSKRESTILTIIDARLRRKYSSPLKRAAAYLSMASGTTGEAQVKLARHAFELCAGVLNRDQDKNTSRALSIMSDAAALLLDSSDPDRFVQPNILLIAVRHVLDERDKSHGPDIKTSLVKYLWENANAVQLKMSANDTEYLLVFLCLKLSVKAEQAYLQKNQSALMASLSSIQSPWRIGLTKVLMSEALKKQERPAKILLREGVKGMCSAPDKQRTWSRFWLCAVNLAFAFQEMDLVEQCLDATAPDYDNPCRLTTEMNLASVNGNQKQASTLAQRALARSFELAPTLDLSDLSSDEGTTVTHASVASLSLLMSQWVNQKEVPKMKETFFRWKSVFVGIDPRSEAIALIHAGVCFALVHEDELAIPLFKRGIALTTDGELYPTLLPKYLLMAPICKTEEDARYCRDNFLTKFKELNAGQREELLAPKLKDLNSLIGSNSAFADRNFRHSLKPYIVEFMNRPRIRSNPAQLALAEKIIKTIGAD